MSLKLAWSEEDTERLKTLVLSGVSAARVAVILKRQVRAVKKKARDIGVPFKFDRDLAKERRQVLNDHVASSESKQLR